MEQLLEQVNKVMSQIVQVEADDLPELVDLHGRLELIRDQVEQIESLHDDQRKMIQRASTGAGDLIEKIILQEAEDAGETLRIVAQACESLGKLLEQITEGNSAAEVEFPAALNLACGAEKSASKPTDSECPNISLPDNVDEAIFGEFLSSQPDVLANLEAAILAAEKDPSQENRNAITGILHNLKGEAGLMGLQEISGFCHETESMLIEAGSDFPAEKLFAAKDWLSKAIEQLSGADTGSKADESDQMIGENKTFPGSAGAKNQETDKDDACPVDEQITILENDIPLVMDFINESGEHLELAEGEMLTIEDNPEDAEAVNSIFRAFHTIKGVAGFLNLKPIGDLGHATENLLDLARKGKLTLTGASIDVVFESIDAMKHMLGVLQQAAENQQPFEQDYPRSAGTVHVDAHGAGARGISEGFSPHQRRDLPALRHQSARRQERYGALSFGQTGASKPLRFFYGIY